MEFNPYATEDKQQKIRIIVAASAIAVIVLGIATWAIIAIVNGKNNFTADQASTVAVDDGATVKETVSEAPKTEGVSTVTTLPTPTTTATTTKSTTAKSSVPETGPEELLPLALVAGVATTFAMSKKFAKRNA